MLNGINSLPIKLQRPRVSVCIATYNGERFISRQLQTILRQLDPEDEVVVSDDSSTDRTVEFIEMFHDKRIRLFGGQRFRSPTYNFEHALKQASGEFIFLSDQDDEWVDGWVETALAALNEVSLVVSDADIIDAEGIVRPPDEARLYYTARKPGVIQNLFRNSYVGCCCAFRREVLEAALPFPKKLAWHDWWIGLIANVFFSTRFIEERKIRHRRHDANTSPPVQKSTYSLFVKLRMRWNLANALLRRVLTR